MIEVTKPAFSEDGKKALERHLYDRVSALKAGLDPLFTTNLVRWRKVYESVPAETVREFPWHNASNLIVPIAGIFSDTLHARIMAAVWKTRPVFNVGITGGHRGEAEPLRAAWEEWLCFNAVEPEELNLYEVEREWFGEAIRLGTSTVKSPVVQEYEDAVIPAGDGSGKYEMQRSTVYDGPRPEKLAFEDFLIPPAAKSVEAADIIIHRIKLEKHQLVDRKFRKFYDPREVDKILGSPDRQSPEYIQQQREGDANARTVPGYGWAEWDIHECWLKWRGPNEKHAPRIIVWYHFKTRTILRTVFDFYGVRPFVTARLLFRDSQFHGYGMCELMENFQEEISKMHNQRIDNRDVANTRVWAVDPDSKIHQGYQIYPSAMVPARKGEIEAIGAGDISASSIDEERNAIELAERRSGVSPPMQGYGAGQNTKRGVYTAMGTLSLLQEGNRRTDLNISDMRFAHTKLGRIISKEYAEWGIDERKLAQFGDRHEAIMAAAQLVKDGKLGLPVSSATASVNREVEKQNSLMMTQVMARHYGMVGQLLTTAANGMLPESVRIYAGQVIDASNLVMKKILRYFDEDDVDALIPDPKKGGQGAGQGQGQGPQPVRGNAQQPQPGSALAPIGGGGAAGGLVPGPIQ